MAGNRGNLIVENIRLKECPNSSNGRCYDNGEVHLMLWIA